MVDHVLLRHADAVFQHLGDNRDVPRMLKLTALLPNQQRTRHRQALAAVGKRLQRQNIIVHDLTQIAQRKNIVGHAHVGKHGAVVEIKEAAGKLDALPLIPHVLFVQIVTECGIIHLIKVFKGVIIRGVNRYATGGIT